MFYVTDSNMKVMSTPADLAAAIVTLLAMSEALDEDAFYALAPKRPCLVDAAWQATDAQQPQLTLQLVAKEAARRLAAGDSLLFDEKTGPQWQG